MKKILCLLLMMALLLSGCVVIVEFPGEETLQQSAPELIVHYLDVGQADCALIECDGEYMVVDGGNKDDGRLVVAYLQQQGVEELSAVVCSHAHEDHVGGLPSVLAVYPTRAVYAPTSTYASEVYDDFLRYTGQQGLSVTIPEPGDVFTLGSAQVTVLGPVKKYAETNDTSIVLRVDFGKTAFLFTGDMELTAESDMVDYWQEREKADLLKADVLKVGHHGSDTSTGYRFLYEVKPDYGVISVGTGNTYGHPHEVPLSRLNQSGAVLLRTDRLGTVVAHSDGAQITFTWANQSASPDNAEPAPYHDLIGNLRSGRFHAPNCEHLPAKENRVMIGSYDNAVTAGFVPCGVCLP